MTALRARMETEKTAVSLAYFKERSGELVAMGAELLTEGRKAGWAQCNEKMLALVRAKLLKLDTATIDPDLSTTEEAANVISIEDCPDPTDCSNEPTKGSSADPEGNQDELDKDLEG